MLDFIQVKEKYNTSTKKIEIFPIYIVKRSKDLMIRGNSFYAIWDEEKGFWSTDAFDVQRLIDKEVEKVYDKVNSDTKTVKYLADFSSNKWTEFQKCCKSFPDHYVELDKKIIFSNDDVKKSDYATRKLPYPLEDGKIDAYNELMNTLYDPKEREKLEWAIGSVIKGDSRNLQKFFVLYGGPGTGKSTVLNIIQMLFEGYYSTFDSKALGSRNSEFALEAFKSNPIVAIEHDGDLSRIDDNTRLNSLVSHEEIMINEKFKNAYPMKVSSMIFMGTNKPVKITDAKSGILRRLIDVVPTGNKVKPRRYDELMNQIIFERGAIAQHCLDVYNKLGSKYYNTYTPTSMMVKTNDFYNFIEDNYIFFAEDNPEGVTLTVAWRRYKEYCDDAGLKYPLTKTQFKDELKSYFKYYYERVGNVVNVYKDFLFEKFDFYKLNEETNKKEIVKVEEEVEKSWLQFNKRTSLFDKMFFNCPAQYANDTETPSKKWEDTKTVLEELDTKKLHYVRVPKNVIVIDFDLKDKDGNKSYELNYEAASKWPQTYAELSKSGAGIHLHYIYEGNVSDLSRIYDENIEIKVFTGKSSLRRQLTKCNDIPIATINSGLPLRERSKNVVTEEGIKNEKHLRNLIKKGLRKEVFPNTKPNIDYIYKILEDAYDSGMEYDVMDMAPDIQVFANNSSHQALYCLKTVSKMHFRSEEKANVDTFSEDIPIVFYDVEVFPNLFIVCWKKQGKENVVVRMINPTADEVEQLFKFKLVGFNNRRYDNHILWAKSMGYTNEQLFKLSQKIIDGDKTAFFGEAYNLSYTDIYDFLSSANKMGLKKWEIKLGIHHMENAYDWNKPVPKDKWEEIADYCYNDVMATEAVWDANQEDWLAREILADLAGMTVNDTTNSLTTRIIIGTDKHPQSQFVYTDLSTIFPGYKYNPRGIDKDEYKPNTKIVSGKSIYMGEDPGEGGYAYANPGMYHDIALLDVASMHPHSIIRLNLFGDEYTMRFADIVKVRLLIKHKEYDKAKHIMDGKLAKYLDDPKQAKKLANALKTAINSVYGLTSASFDNKLRDPRNNDNIVAKYGALFMITLKHEVEKKGFTVVHIKTDSIKIANATPEIIEYVTNFGKEYGFTFEHEATYKKMCIVNDAVYIAKYADGEHEFELSTGEKIMTSWTATGKQFQIPYLFKTLFAHKPINFKDMCETFSTNSALYLDMNEGLPDVSDAENQLAKLEKNFKSNKITEDELIDGRKKLMKEIEAGHDYHFVGKIGQFCPMVPGSGGGVLLREQDGKFNAATGTKKPGKVPKGEIDTYYWMESEMVKQLGKEKDIDKSFYNALIDDAIITISKYGDFERFSSDNDTEDMSWMDISTMEEELPFNF